MRPLWLLRPAMRPEAGGGHVARCTVLARAMAAAGLRPVFAVSSDNEEWCERLQAAGLQTAVVAGPEAAAAMTLAGVLVDDYSVLRDESALRAWKSVGRWLAVFQDEGAEPCPLANAVLAPTLPDGGPVIGGIAHAIVDPGYAALRRVVTDIVARIVVTFGRRDSADATSVALAGLDRARRAGLDAAITVVIGSAAPHRQTVERQAGIQGAAVVVDAPGLHGLLQEADLVVGAGGVSLLERACAGVPSVTVLNAGNQRRLSELLEAGGATVIAGAMSDSDLSAERVADAVLRLCADPAARCRMSTAARSAVDGHAGRRVAERLREMMLADSPGRP